MLLWWGPIPSFPWKTDRFSTAYFEAYDNLIQGIEKCFQQEDFLIYRNTQDIFLNDIAGKK